MMQSSIIRRKPAVILPCAHCKKPVEVMPCFATRNAYCNNDCKKGWHATRRAFYSCRNCGQEYSVRSSAATEKASFCTAACRTAFSADAQKRLEEKRAISPTTQCWEWQGPLDSWGYGQIFFNRKLVLVHRLSAHIFLSFDLKSRLCICHKCDNPKCFNPDHLFIGDVATNNLDKKNKNRIPSVAGSINPNAKLSESQVRIIRQRFDAGESGALIAKDFGITTTMANRIGRRKAWASLKD